MVGYNMTMTNKKRAPGGGRKPKGPIPGNTGWLQARIREDLRSQLEQAAARNGRSLSQEAQFRLAESFSLPTELQRKWGPPDVRVLARLVSLVVRSVHVQVGAHPFSDAGDLAWYRNPFTHVAVAAAIAELLAHQRPAGPVEAPSAVKEFAKRSPQQATPEGIGQMCAMGVLNQLATAEPAPKSPGAGAHYGDSHYVFPDIRTILGDTDGE
jgi:hypothetical protein